MRQIDLQTASQTDSKSISLSVNQLTNQLISQAGSQLVCPTSLSVRRIYRQKVSRQAVNQTFNETECRSISLLVSLSVKHRVMQ